jgi:hypothetical protein
MHCDCDVVCDRWPWITLESRMARRFRWCCRFGWAPWTAGRVYAHSRSILTRRSTSGSLGPSWSRYLSLSLSVSLSVSLSHPPLHPSESLPPATHLSPSLLSIHPASHPSRSLLLFQFLTYCAGLRPVALFVKSFPSCCDISI